MTSGSESRAHAGLPIFLEGFDELAVKLRELAFGALVLTGAPVSSTALSEWTGEDIVVVERSLDNLAQQGRIDRDVEGRVVGSAGLTIGDGPHGLSFGNRSFRTWCAFDALGIPASLAVDGIVETACAVCSSLVRVVLRAGEPVVADEARLWMSAGGPDMRADFCTPTVLLCSEAHAQSWAERHHWGGELLSLGEAAEIGGRNWASCTAAFVSLREHEASAANKPFRDLS